MEATDRTLEGEATEGFALEPTLAGLERDHGGDSAEDLLRQVLQDRLVGDVALVSSFGADSAVLLHMVAEMFVLVAFLGLVIGAVVFADAMIGAAP